MATATSATSLETQRRPWWLTLIMGIVALVLGAIMLWAPVKTKIDTYQFLIFFLGFWWIFQGIGDIISMFVDHSGWGWKLFIGIVSIIAGAYVLMYPFAAGVALPKVFVLVLGIWGLMQGIVLLIMAFKGAGWGAGIVGALGIVFGIVLIANYSVAGMGLAMVWTAAVAGVIGGIVLIFQAFRER